MRVLVCGGRDYQGYGIVYAELKALGPGVEIIHGDARGADTLADSAARLLGLVVRSYPADWARHGKAAGMIRNRLMLEAEQPDLVLAFPGGPGTRGCCELAQKLGIAVRKVGW